MSRDLGWCQTPIGRKKLSPYYVVSSPTCHLQAQAEARPDTIEADLTGEWGYRLECDGDGGGFPEHAGGQVEEQDQEDLQDKVAFELWRRRRRRTGAGFNALPSAGAYFPFWWAA